MRQVNRAANSAARGTCAAVGDDRSVKIKSLEAAKIMKIEWLVLGCIEADFLQEDTRWKALARSTRFTCFCTAQTSIFQQIFVANF